jgi:hypothetical protein
LNRDPSDDCFENLVYLCLEHHDEYDSRSSLSKGLTEAEVRLWRDRLVQKYEGADAKWCSDSGNAANKLPRLHFRSRSRSASEPNYAERNLSRPWRFPLWLVPDRMDLFAYTTASRMDGVCLIERIDLPDRRIVIACVQIVGNPGTSITNSVEDICFQVCERFGIPRHRLVWLEHYDFIDPAEWNLVTFGPRRRDDRFVAPVWTTMTPTIWKELGLKPRKKLRLSVRGVESKLSKLFPWPLD